MKQTFFLLLAAAVGAFATIRNVPADYATIQSAINASVHGDTVLVQPGTYFENINYRGKNIVVTSRFYENKEISFIYSTIINGSTPSHPDSASVVLFINHEDSSAVLQGFTITGGKGTAWPDEHSPGTFVEGGGIHSALASPKILYNLIINNEAVRKGSGIVSGGGGGIRVGDGNPTIANNVIMNNRGLYGAGIVANYTGAVIRNNVIVGNSGGRDFGGGGVWLNGSGPKPKYLENNTIIGNQSFTDGGGLLLLDQSATAVVRNNIIWGNTAIGGAQMSLREDAAISSFYNDIQDAPPAGTNISVHPAFLDSLVILAANSPLVDAGDTAMFYNDPNSAGTALFPSRGTMRNDIGAYGGPGAGPLPVMRAPRFITPQQQFNFGKLRPDSSVMVVLKLVNTGTAAVRFDSVRLAVNASNNITVSRTGPFTLPLVTTDSLTLQWHPLAAHVLQDTLILYHNDTLQARPLRIPLSGNAFSIVPAVKGTMYAASGTIDSAKLYTIDTLSAIAQIKGKSGFSQIISLRTNPKNGELIALVNSASPQLMRISATNAESFPLPQLVMTNPKGMVFRPDGTLLIGTFSGTVYSVNMTTGGVTSVGSNGLRISGLAYNPVDGALWMSVRPPASGKDNIYRLNPSTMQATLVGTTGFGIATKDITFDSKGRLFGVVDTTGGQSYLIEINTETAKGTVIGGLKVKGIETIELQSYYVTAVNSDQKSLPEQFSLLQNYPNPFNPSTTIRFRIPEQANVVLTVYDVIGREISRLAEGMHQAGEYEVRFNASALSSGVYYYKLTTDKFSAVKKMLILQ